MAKTLLKRALMASGVFRWSARLRSRAAAILMYHSVLEDPASVANSLGGMIHRRDIFARQMELLARQFHPVSLDQVARFVRGEGDLPERAVVVTFDDGYTDNCEVALPILDRTGVLATFYVTVDCVENRRLPWPSRLRYAFYTTSVPTWTDENGKSWSLDGAENRNAAYLSACDRVAQTSGAILEKIVSDIEAKLEARLPENSANLMMTWEQIRTLLQHGHIVGSHTMTHPNMAYLGREDVSRELVDSKRCMETRMKTKIQHFSYPCPALSPNWNEQTLQETQQAGYATAVTTSRGLAHRNDNPLALKRVLPTKSVDGLRWNLETAFAGRVV